MPGIPTLPNAEFPVPQSLGRVVDLAQNLWWSWHPEGHSLWVQLDASAWERYHNPVQVLSTIDRSKWLELEQIEAVHDSYNAAVHAFDKYMNGRKTWMDRQTAELDGPVAYFCTEFGVHPSLPLYSGGLGILAGDHAKSASDLGIPFVGVGLFYRRGYFRQEVDPSGNQQHIYPNLDVRDLPIRPVAGPGGGQLKVPVELPGRDVMAAVWKLDVGLTELLLLDTDIPDNAVSDRPITHQLYVSGREMRFCQELILGVGGIRALDALGIEPSVFHVNEGHAAMSTLERIAMEVERGLPLDAAREKLRSRTLFTLHTPVPAGNETFHRSIAEKYLGPWAARLGIPMPELLDLASAEEGNIEMFDLGALAIRSSAITNGVSKKHGEVSTESWQHLIGGPAAHVTNGVHTPTWMGRDGGRMLSRALGRSWPTKLLENPTLLDQARELPDEMIWNAHQGRKEIFSRFARGRLRSQMARHGASPDELRAVDSMLPTDRLTLGFARRFATYKRATLMFRDRGRLHHILTNPDRPIQIVFAGKAHPADKLGQAFIRELSELSRSDDFRGHVYVLEDYDARVARFLVQGVDVWVNNPRPPMEASGTSGMKAAINGVPNLSVLDGWWIEGFNGRNGWAFGHGEADPDYEGADNRDAHEFYEVLADQVAPLYYDIDPETGLSEGWIAVMREAITSSILAFSTHRMVADYCELAYFPIGASNLVNAN
jgi:starch phosphorylase